MPCARTAWSPSVAFNAYFAVKHHTGAGFDADSGVSHERTEVRDPDGRAIEVDLWTGCYTPRELRWLFDRHGLAVTSLSSVEPGRTGSIRRPPSRRSSSSSVVADSSNRC